MTPGLRRAAALLGALLAAAAAPGGEGARKAATDLKGSWSLVKLDANGQSVPEEQTRDVTVEITATDLRFNNGPKFAVKLDPTTTPPLIDVTTEQKDVFEGIFQLKGDTLTICVGPPGPVRERPTEFSGGTGRILLVLQRKKP
jgi:uncharacterized protein (TIGR03067 family)